jgi:hypothetical protein
VRFTEGVDARIDLPELIGAKPTEPTTTDVAITSCDLKPISWEYAPPTSFFGAGSFLERARLSRSVKYGNYEIILMGLISIMGCFYLKSSKTALNRKRTGVELVF